MSDLHPFNTVTEMAPNDGAATGTGDLFLDGLCENGEANIVYALKCTIAHYEDGLITQREAERRLIWVASSTSDIDEKRPCSLDADNQR